ncbi:MAG: SH3 domain-containing C40 family peptidase [Eubacteriales bacterium]|nr:SH3 domain-containing C40 family peptidase [Eubacteriales bacterium]
MLNRKKPSPKQLRHLIITTTVSLVAAIPVLCQPLGLAFFPAISSQSPTISMLSAVPAAESAKGPSAYKLAPVEMMSVVDSSFSRQSSSANGSTAEKPTENPAEPLQIEVREVEIQLPELYWLTVDEYPLYVNTSALNFRAQPNTDAEILDVLELADKIICISESNKEWIQVKSDDQVGFISSEYVTRELVFRPVEQTRYVDASQLNLRAEASTDSEVLAKLDHLQKLTRIAVADGWSKVKTADGKTGFVASKYLTEQGPVPVSRSSSSSSSRDYSSGNAPANPSGSRIVDIAYQALGTPYVWGSSSLSGMDCSGFTSWVYRQAGISISRSSRDYPRIGTGVSYSNARPGDILVMDARRSGDGQLIPSHVALYIGGDKMIHASSSKRKVIVASVSSILNWGAKLITVRRIGG